MKTKPILFSTPMVQAILDGRKTQTRRIVKDSMLQENENEFKEEEFLKATIKKPINKGDILWVRETWFPTRYDFKELLQSGITSLSKGNIIKYKADNDYDPIKDCVGRSWKPSIFMPKEACRIFLEVTNDRVERLQDITEGDAKAEGVEKLSNPKHVQRWKDYLIGREFLTSPMYSFKTLWQSINGKESWKQNPWVWVYEFKQVEKPKNFLK